MLRCLRQEIPRAGSVADECVTIPGFVICRTREGFANMKHAVITQLAPGLARGLERDRDLAQPLWLWHMLLWRSMHRRVNRSTGGSGARGKSASRRAQQHIHPAQETAAHEMSCWQWLALGRRGSDPGRCDCEHAELHHAPREERVEKYEGCGEASERKQHVHRTRV